MSSATAMAGAPPSRRDAITERVIDAALRVLVDGGWGQLTPKAVARTSGVSQRAVQSRCPTRSEVAIALWAERLGPVLLGSLEALLRAGGQLGPDARQREFTRAFAELARPDPSLVAAVELVMVSHFDPALGRAVGADLGDALSLWCSPARGSVPDALAARRALLLAIGLGLVGMGPLAPRPDLDLDPEAELVLRAMQEGRQPVVLPRAQARHLRRRPQLAPDDPALQALLTATLDEVGDRGFDGATTAGIARRAGYTEGLLFSRYASKLDLFVDASRTQLGAAMVHNEAFMARLAPAHGRGVAEAVLIREFMHPQAEDLRTLNLEQVRLSWHEPRLRDVVTRETAEFVASLSSSGAAEQRVHPVARYHLGVAISLGVVLLAQVHPQAWRLPYDVMTIPLEDG